jgi:sec-independent protein translocase protein TatB
MFDVGFWELALIGVVALLVVGPDKLPGLARTVGLYVGKIRRTVAQVRADIEREVRADELRKSVEEATALREAYESLEEARKDIGGAVGSLETARSALEEAEASARPKDEGPRSTEEPAAEPSSTDEGGPVEPAVRGVTTGGEAQGASARRAASDPSGSRDDDVRAEAGERRADS